MRLVTAFALSALFVSLSVAGCSSDEPTVENTQPPVTSPDAEAPGSPGGDFCASHCSPDLKQLQGGGCGGAVFVIEECKDGRGCTGHSCGDPCEAAARSGGSTGCEFWAVPPDSPITAPGGCFAVTIANTWDLPTGISAELGSETLDISKSIYTVERKGTEIVYARLDELLAPGQAATVFLGHDATNPSSVRCPEGVTPALLVDPGKHGTAIVKAFRLKTAVPVAAHSIFPYEMKPSVSAATPLFPVSLWDRSYVAVSPLEFGPEPKGRTLQIVSSEDGTEIAMVPTVDIPAAEGVAGATKGTAQTWRLNKGEVLQFHGASLTGSPLESSKPVGVFGGAECTSVPTASDSCDLLHLQIPSWYETGTGYVVVPYLSRRTPFSREKVPYTIVGGRNGTVLTYDPSRPAGAPATIERGETVSFVTDEVFVVSSQAPDYPFHVAIYMTNGAQAGTKRGDSDFVNVPATSDYRRRHLFFTDPVFPDTTLTVVREKTAGGFMPVELGCGGEITAFQPIDARGDYEFAWVTLTKDFEPQKISTGACGYGRHEARSAGRFAVTVWGTADAASYGFVATMGEPKTSHPVPISVP